MDNGISIIVCCYNSSELLPRTLEHLALLKVPKNAPCELILVDNGSTDKTSAVAIEEWRKYETSISLNIVMESKAGLIFAREKGINKAKHEIIIFCDDDNWLHENYLLVALNTMNKNSSIGALGGHGEAVSNIDFPDWFENVKGAYACGKQWPVTGFCSGRMYLWGAGLVSRKSLLLKVFDSPLRLTGRNGAKLMAGDDGEICMRILLMGYELYYNSLLNYKHYMQPFRLTQEYYIRMNQGFKDCNKIINQYRLEIVKKRNRGIKRYWVYVKDSIILFLIKFKFIKPLPRYVLNIVGVKYFK
jgi:glycosyltransferase involved in cell wall biosynthesis